MKTILISSFVIMAALVMAADEEPQWSQTKQISVQSPNGEVIALTKSAPFTWRDAKGREEPKQVQFVFVPTNRLIWCRALPFEQIFVLENKIVGVYSAVGATLHFFVSKERLPEDKSPDDPAVLKQYFLKSVNGYNSSAERDPADRDCSVERIAGEQFMMDIRMARAPLPLQIIAISPKKQGVVFSLRSEINKNITLVLDQELNPVEASVEGVAVFPKKKE
jgi:hypothetical protein